MKYKLLIVLVILIFQSAALAQVGAPATIRFTNVELSAGAVLMKPELNSIELQDQAGTFSPAPALRALGLDEQRFDLNFNGLSELANIHFDHLRGLAPSIRFEGSELVVRVPVEDHDRVGRSVIGTISVKGVVLSAHLALRTRADGSPELFVASTGFDGSLTGSGMLRPGFMINLAKKLLMRTIENEAAKIISKPALQDSITTGLLGWAKFETGQTWHSLVPGTATFYTENGQSGLRYQVQ